MSANPTSPRSAGCQGNSAGFSGGVELPSGLFSLAVEVGCSGWELGPTCKLCAGLSLLLPDSFGHLKTGMKNLDALAVCVSSAPVLEEMDVIKSSLLLVGVEIGAGEGNRTLITGVEGYSGLKLSVS